MKYNGWDNYQTWVTNLWIDSDQYVREMVEEILDREDDRDDAIYNLAHNLQEMFEEGVSELNLNASVFSDLLNSALSEVNWREIAIHLIEEVEQ